MRSGGDVTRLLSHERWNSPLVVVFVMVVAACGGSEAGQPTSTEAPILLSVTTTEQVTTSADEPVTVEVSPATAAPPGTYKALTTDAGSLELVLDPDAFLAETEPRYLVVTQLSAAIAGDSFNTEEQLSMTVSVQAEPARSISVADRSVTRDGEPETFTGELLWLEDGSFLQRIAEADWETTETVIRHLSDLTGLEDLHREVAAVADEFDYVGDDNIGGRDVTHFRGPLVYFESETLVDLELWWIASPSQGHGGDSEIWVDSHGLIVAYKAELVSDDDGTSFEAGIEVTLDFTQPTEITIPPAH